MPSLRAKGWAIATGASTACVAAAVAIFLDDTSKSDVLSFYQDHLREPLFLGFLTVAAFLFSLQTFIVVTMKENVYDQTQYVDLLADLQKANPKITRYGPLRNFSALLSVSIAVSMVAAILQFSIGLMDNFDMAIAAMWLAVWSTAMFFVSLWYLHSNLNTWFSFLEKPPSS